MSVAFVLIRPFLDKLMKQTFKNEIKSNKNVWTKVLEEKIYIRKGQKKRIYNCKFSKGNAV